MKARVYDLHEFKLDAGRRAVDAVFYGTDGPDAKLAIVTTYAEEMVRYREWYAANQSKDSKARYYARTRELVAREENRACQSS